MDRPVETNPFFDKQPWALDIADVLGVLEVDSKHGLSSKQVRQRQQKFGPNQLRKHKKRGIVEILINQLKSIIIVLLATAALFAFWLGEYVDGWAIVAVIVINTVIGFFTELRAVRSMEALFKLGKVSTRVRRAGKIIEIDAEELVPGDVVIIEGGDIITADLRIIKQSKLQSDESALTGESLPVSKQGDAVAEDTVLAGRDNMLYKGTAVTRGSGEAVVVSTGLDTELGAISSLVEEADQEQTPLEERLDKLGYRLITITLIIALFVVGSGIWAGKELFLMVETGIALAVAAIPEGLPIVATIALAKGIRLMARKNALVNRLSSVETLGATGIICTDKTGTLTENKMTVTGFYLSGDRDISLSEHKMSDNSDLRLALEVGVLCNNASLYHQEKGGTGDPLEIALLEAAKKAGLVIDELPSKYPEIREEAFDADVKMMATWNKKKDGEYRVSVKGAPGAVLDVCSSVMVDGEVQPLQKKDREQWEELNLELGREGLRMLAFAVKTVDTIEGNPYEELTLIGLVALSDPPRSDVKPAIFRCQQAGIRVVMITGDQKATAESIAESVGIDLNNREAIHGRDLPDIAGLEMDSPETNEIYHTSVFSRVSPSQKLDLIELFQKKGQIVAMTGDGVNDAPALKKADIGIAMGQRGTQVAQEASDMVLLDDAFSTIVSAIEQGRVIFNNIRRFIYYLMSCNVSEVMVVAMATIIGTALPILPLQILFLNLVTDVFPALALGVGEGEAGIMQKSPRSPEQPILGRSEWIGIAGYAFIITLSVLGSLFIGMEYLLLSADKAVTLSFLTLAFAQLWHVFNMRSSDSGFWNNTITTNNYIWAALLLCTGLLFVAVYVPVISDVLKVTPPTVTGWGVVFIMSVIPLLVGQLWKGYGPDLEVLQK
ncbi:ATPase [Aliifodinibius salipaludis]|uniref:ATPase n=1 Tax=Fodinibius salipaludis TaxID=2032627 RepID=A0A2A2GF98_9BACT|nr:cation-transporting P-type ATPase [Aliifodinibius salipaludis]PAU95563.1 ATPase [Aliifodinibius salipaludis]